MNVQTFRRYSREDYQKAQSWFFDFLDNLNPMVDALNQLLHSNIDIDNNLRAERQTVSVQHGVSTTVKMQKLTTAPFLVRAGFASGAIVDSVGITAYNVDGTIQVTVNFVGAPTGVIPTMLIFEP